MDMIDSRRIRKDFPILDRKDPVVYLDSACMALKPLQVIDAVNEYYTEFPGCHGRSSHQIGRVLDAKIAESRKAIQRFFGTKGEVIFTKNTTEAINLVAHSFPFEKGDTVITTNKEHNSNLIPWIQVQRTKGIHHSVFECDESFSLEDFDALLDREKPRLVSMVHASNIDGTTIPAKEVCKISHEHGALVLLDGAQSAPHKDLNLKRIGCDFFACSGHKMMGPSGIGCLIGTEDALQKLSQFLVGGETVANATYDEFIPEDIPARFEAGLQHYAGIIGMAEACRYIDSLGRKRIEKHDTELNRSITESLEDEGKITVIGPKDPSQRGGIFNFQVEGMDSHDVAHMLDSKNILVRSGMHCVHSWYNARKISGSVRASVYCYTSKEECAAFADEVRKIIKLVR